MQLRQKVNTNLKDPIYAKSESMPCPSNSISVRIYDVDYTQV